MDGVGLLGVRILEIGSLKVSKLLREDLLLQKGLGHRLGCRLLLRVGGKEGG